MQWRRDAQVVAGPELYLRVAGLRPLNAAAVRLPTTNEPSANELANKEKGGSTTAISNGSIMQTNVDGPELITQTQNPTQNKENNRRKASLRSPIVSQTYSFNIRRTTSE